MFTGKLSAILWTGLVILAVTVCTRLGFWQLERAEQKQERQQLLDSWSAQGVMPLTKALRHIESEDATGLQVGFDAKLQREYWLLDNQVYQGRVGYDLLVLALPPGSSHWLLVNLGFVPAPSARSELPAIELPEQLTLTQALVKEGTLAQFTLSDARAEQGWPKRIQQIAITQMSEQTRKPIHPFMVYAQHRVEGIGAIPHYQPVTMSADKHRAYAWQWFLIALAALVIAVSAYWRARRTHAAT
ncbi:SURF1 family protein [Pseudoalteromonas sp. BDTF-M6]|uniref:SURF1 family protein n=1 Tax=Pseudoalteromonas sp. BDTF-M6 TaxID=2796132 RepID=UPI001BAF6B78|nr:SURF1 family protein [Pseudoalteromonas sp. BDTF-M6]